MPAQTITADQSDGDLQVRTGVTGPAAKMGHRLTIAMASWRAEVRVAGGCPEAVTMTVDVGSLQVLGGEGGVTPLTDPEKVLVRSNALKTFDAKRFTQISYTAERVEPTERGYRLDGALQIHGKTRSHPLEVTVAEESGQWLITGETEVRQSDYGIKPYSMMLGAMKVADEVTVSLSLRLPRA
ncbi:YceI family protein [Mycobacterium sp. 21AC1]|uniref:YceI family protein n=1 Tax=[Mycobacterium] appelbergii TaxID=2939269 RepID=UPI0029390E12|nr:YceI family protein [Mycobacterium sp. 21AC1]MDV3123849.1 YceI family protein [Mycobacterium sp. 21AC1]